MDRINLDELVIKGIDDILPGKIVITAYYNEQIVAKFAYIASIGSNTDSEVEYLIPHILNVYAFKHQGVGKKIMEKVSEQYRIIAFNTLNNIPDDKDDVHYTDEGLNFMRSCIKAGYVEDGDVSSDSFDEEDNLY